MNNIQKDTYLTEVCVIRLLLVAMVIIYHCFCPFIGGDYWEPIIDSYPSSYSLITRLPYSFMLEAFTFISGYVLGFQVSKGKHTVSFKNTIVKKAKRLLIPSAIFSFLYILAFEKFSNYIYIHILAEGAGHLWYLPMLFWCFVAIYIIEKCNLKIYQYLPLLFLIALVSVLKFPLRLSEAAYYLFFFYCGYAIKKTNYDFSKYIKPKYILLSVSAFITLFSIYTFLSSKSDIIDGNFILKISRLLFIRLIKISVAITGTFSLMISVIYLIKSKRLIVTDTLLKISGYAFGIYILQEFIIRIIYYKMGVSQFTGIVTPFLTALFTILFSIIIVSLCHKNKIGKYLLS